MPLSATAAPFQRPPAKAAAQPQALPQVLAELQKNVFKGEKVRTLMERLQEVVSGGDS